MLLYWCYCILLHMIYTGCTWYEFIVCYVMRSFSNSNLKTIRTLLLGFYVRVYGDYIVVFIVIQNPELKTVTNKELELHQTRVLVIKLKIKIIWFVKVKNTGYVILQIDFKFHIQYGPKRFFSLDFSAIF